MTVLRHLLHPFICRIIKLRKYNWICQTLMRRDLSSKIYHIECISIIVIKMKPWWSCWPRCKCWTICIKVLLLIVHLPVRLVVYIWQIWNSIRIYIWCCHRYSCGLWKIIIRYSHSLFICWDKLRVPYVNQKW